LNDFDDDLNDFDDDDFFSAGLSSVFSGWFSNRFIYFSNDFPINFWGLERLLTTTLDDFKTSSIF
jgi:hypothetical protein